MVSPKQAKEAYEQFQSERKAAEYLGLPKTTFRRLKAKAQDESAKKGQPRQRPNPLSVKQDNKKIVNLVLPDIHAPYEDSTALDIVLEYATKNYSINQVTIAGDMLDCLHASKFSRNPRDRMSIPEEIDYGSQLLDELIKIFPDCKFVYINGNHERRLAKYLLDKAPDLVGMKGTTIEEQLELSQKGIEFVDNLKLLEETGEPYSIGQLYYLHGDEIGGAGVHLARNKYMKIQKNILFAHHHQPQSYFHKSFNDIYGAWCTGCLCSTTPSYAPTSQHIQGFAVVDYCEDNTFSVQNKVIINGKVY